MFCLSRKSQLFVSAAVLFALTASAAKSQESTPPRQVRLTITVRDKSGRYVSSLRKDQITVFDEKIPQELVFFQEEKSVPASIGFVLDISKLKLGNLLSGSTQEVRQFMAASGPANEYFMIAFDNKPYIANDFTQDRNQIVAAFAALAKASSSKKTALYDAARLGIEKVKAGRNPKHVLLLISDDRDSASNLKRSELIDLLRESDVLLYAIRITTPGSNNLHSIVLDELCSTTGGIALYPASTAEFMDAFEMLALELQHQYSAAFSPSSISKAAGWHHLEFNVKPLELKSLSSKEVKNIPLFARSREGYYFGP